MKAMIYVKSIVLFIVILVCSSFVLNAQGSVASVDLKWIKISIANLEKKIDECKTNVAGLEAGLAKAEKNPHNVSYGMVKDMRQWLKDFKLCIAASERELKKLKKKLLMLLGNISMPKNNPPKKARPAGDKNKKELENAKKKADELQKKIDQNKKQGQKMDSALKKLEKKEKK